MKKSTQLESSARLVIGIGLSKADTSQALVKRDIKDKNGRVRRPWTKLSAYMRDDEKKKKAPTDKKKPEKTEVEAPSVREVLNKIVADIREIQAGTTEEILGLSVERHQNGEQFRVGDIVFHGMRAVSLGIFALHALGKTR